MLVEKVRSGRSEMEGEVMTQVPRITCRQVHVKTFRVSEEKGQSDWGELVVMCWKLFVQAARDWNDCEGTLCKSER